MGEARKDALRFDFDRSVKLEFHGSTVSSDGGLLACRELDEAFALTAMADAVLIPVIDRYRDPDVAKLFRGDAAFAIAELYETLEAEGYRYAIRLPANEVLYREIAHLMKRPVGRPSAKPVVLYHRFEYRAASWPKCCRGSRSWVTMGLLGQGTLPGRRSNGKSPLMPILRGYSLMVQRRRRRLRRMQLDLSRFRRVLRPNSRKKRFLVLAVLAAMVLGSLADSAGAWSPPVIYCELIVPDEAPKLDGTLDSPAWQKAQPSTGSYSHGGPVNNFNFRLLCDGEWLYVGIAGKTIHGQGIKKPDTECMSVFLASSKISDMYVTYHAHLTGDGKITKKNVGYAGSDDDWKVAAKVGRDLWTMVFALPIDRNFSVVPAAGDAFDLNVSRTRAQFVGDAFDIYHQWSFTGISQGTRYRFGEVVVGNPADRLKLIGEQLLASQTAAKAAMAALDDQARSAANKANSAVSRLLSASGQRIASGSVSVADVRAFEGDARKAEYNLRKAILDPRGVIVWNANPMDTPQVGDLPVSTVEDATEIDIRVLGDEWETAAVVVSNLRGSTLDGQVTIKDFVGDDGETKIHGWDIVTVRSAPSYYTEAGRVKRDPLPLLQEGDLFRVPAGENELLWLQFRTRGLPAGRYTSEMTVRSLDNTLDHKIKLTFEVLPIKLGAEGQPKVNPFNSMLRGKDLQTRFAHCEDYYLNVGTIYENTTFAKFLVDEAGNILDQELDFTDYDTQLKHGHAEHFDFNLIYFFPNRQMDWWPCKREDGIDSYDFEQWSPKYTLLLHKSRPVGIKSRIDAG